MGTGPFALTQTHRSARKSRREAGGRTPHAEIPRRAARRSSGHLARLGPPCHRQWLTWSKATWLLNAKRACYKGRPPATRAHVGCVPENPKFKGGAEQAE